MPESKSHKATVNRLLSRYGGNYSPEKGADIKTPHHGTIEVETAETVREAPTQLKGYHGPVYIAGTSKPAVDKALEIAEGTTIGVMDKTGHIIKPSTRR